jgi:hypothetical protein
MKETEILIKLPNEDEIYKVYEKYARYNENSGAPYYSIEFCYPYYMKQRICDYCTRKLFKRFKEELLEETSIINEKNFKKLSKLEKRKFKLKPNIYSINKKEF